MKNMVWTNQKLPFIPWHELSLPPFPFPFAFDQWKNSVTDEEESSERLRDPVHVTSITCFVFGKRDDSHRPEYKNSTKICFQKLATCFIPSPTSTGFLSSFRCLSVQQWQIRALTERVVAEIWWRFLKSCADYVSNSQICLHFARLCPICVIFLSPFDFVQTWLISYFGKQVKA